MDTIPIQNRVKGGITINQLAAGNLQPQNQMQYSQGMPYQKVQKKRANTGTGQQGVLLKKGQKIALTAPNHGTLDGIKVGLGWDLKQGGAAYDLDVEAFLLGANGKVLGDDWFVFYNQKVSPDGAVVCGEDNTTGMGDGDDESIEIELSRVHPEVAKIVLIVTINEALEKGYHFGNVENAYVRIVDKISRQELIRFQLTEYYTTVCSMVVGELYRYQGAWKFNAVGNGTAEGLMGLCLSYGVHVIE